MQDKIRAFLDKIEDFVMFVLLICTFAYTLMKSLGGFGIHISFYESFCTVVTLFFLTFTFKYPVKGKDDVTE